MKLHIIIPSKLEKHGGGIETWLSYFIKTLKNKEKYEKIIVYGYFSEEKHEKIYHDFLENDINFVFVNYNSTKSGIKNIINFSRLHFLNFRKEVENFDHVIYIGTVYLAPLMFLVNKFIRKKKFKSIVWVRSKTVGEMKARGSKLIFIASVFEQYLIKNADIIITNGTDTQDYYKKLYPKFIKKIHKIFNAVDFEKFSMFPVTSLQPNIVFMGRYVEAKGFSYFVKSVEEYKKIHKSKEVQFTTYGHGIGDGLVNTLYIEDKGPYDASDLLDIFMKYDIFMFLNKSDSSGGLSHALLEVMAAGKLIIAWKNEVHCQVLNEKNSLLVDEGDISELVRTYRKVFEKEWSANFLENLRINARETAKKYSLENHIENYRDIVNRKE